MASPVHGHAQPPADEAGRAGHQHLHRTPNPSVVRSAFRSQAGPSCNRDVPRLPASPGSYARPHRYGGIGLPAWPPGPPDPGQDPGLASRVAACASRHRAASRSRVRQRTRWTAAVGEHELDRQPPAGRFAADTRPPCPSVIMRTMANPSPAPPDSSGRPSVSFSAGRSRQHNRAAPAITSGPARRSAGGRASPAAPAGLPRRRARRSRQGTGYRGTR
jgi:hypothetical protein